MKTLKTPKNDFIWKTFLTVARAIWNRRQTFIYTSLLISFSITAVAATRYVDINNPNPISPYTNWGTAATSIQDAVDVSLAGDAVLVTNGVYQTGGRLASGTSTTNRVVVNKAITVSSVNGPEFTVIRGYLDSLALNNAAAVRCVYLTNGAMLAGFTLTNGGTYVGDNGGGAYCYSIQAVLSNCIISGNVASGSGGGVCSGTLNNSTILKTIMSW